MCSPFCDIIIIIIKVATEGQSNLRLYPKCYFIPFLTLKLSKTCPSVAVPEAQRGVPRTTDYEAVAGCQAAHCREMSKEGHDTGPLGRLKEPDARRPIGRAGDETRQLLLLVRRHHDHRPDAANVPRETGNALTADEVPHADARVVRCTDGPVVEHLQTGYYVGHHRLGRRSYGVNLCRHIG